MTSASRLVSRVKAWAHREPSRVALVEGARRMAYGELAREVDRLGSALAARGLDPGDRVAILLPNCLEAVVACYATWRAGGVVVPLNVQARARDFGRWLSDAAPRFVVYEDGNADVEEALGTLPEPPERIVVPRADEARSEVTWSHRDAGGETMARVAHGDSALAEDAGADDALAMLLYTSGTTGRPKGVMLGHANLRANVDAIVSYLELSADDSIVTILPFYYSYGASVLHTHLAAGARIVLEPNLVFPHLVVETIARERVSGFSGVPSTYALMLKRVQLDKHDLSSLRYVTQAGGGMPPALVQRLRAALPHVRVFVMYGQTEATARLTYLPPDRLEEKLGSVGVPIPGVAIEVRREDGAPAAVGELGEVWARGPNVMLGFWKDDAATSAVVKDGWLKTGDMGHRDADGFLFLAGRRSDMIKTGAHRLHPADVEEVIAELPGVVEAAVVGVEDDVLGQAVKAFVVADAAVTPERIKAHCRERLAAYKIPKTIELVASLPKTASGKVQRAKLAGHHAAEDT